jgi:hypothetical protein
MISENMLSIYFPGVVNYYNVWLIHITIFENKCLQQIVGLRCRDHMQSVRITTNVACSNSAHVEVYPVQHYVITFVDDFLRVLRFPPPIKLTTTI